LNDEIQPNIMSQFIGNKSLSSRMKKNKNAMIKNEILKAKL